MRFLLVLLLLCGCAVTQKNPPKAKLERPLQVYDLPNLTGTVTLCLDLPSALLYVETDQRQAALPARCDRRDGHFVVQKFLAVVATDQTSSVAYNETESVGWYLFLVAPCDSFLAASCREGPAIIAITTHLPSHVKQKPERIIDLRGTAL